MDYMAPRDYITDMLCECRRLREPVDMQELVCHVILKGIHTHTDSQRVNLEKPNFTFSMCLLGTIPLATMLDKQTELLIWTTEPQI